MIEIELPDGTIAEIDTDDEAVAIEAGRRYLRSQAQPTQQPAAPAGPPQPPVPGATPEEVQRLNAQTPQTGTPPSSVVRAGGDLMRNVVAPAVQSTGRVAATIAGMPADVTAGVLNAAPAAVEMFTGPLGEGGQPARIRRPFGGSEMLRDVGTSTADIVGMPLQDQDALPPRQRFAQRVIEEAAASIGGGGLMRGLARMLRAGPLPSPTPGPIERMYQEAPLRATITDATAGAGVATGVQGAETAGYDSPMARVVAGLLGGVGGATIPRVLEGGAAAARQGARMALPDRNVGADPQTGLPVSRAVADEAARLAQGNTVDPPRQVADVIREAVNRYMMEGMPVPTTGLLSNDEGLIGLERGFRASTPRIVRRDREVAEAATDQVRRTAPAGAPTDPTARAAVREQAGETMRGQVAGERAAVERFEMGARRQADEAVAAEEATGGAITQRAAVQPAAATRFDSALVDETMRPMQTRQRELYQAIPDTPASVDDLRTVVQQIRDRVPRTVPEGQAQPTAWLDRLESLETVSIRELNNMRPFIDTAQRQARTAGDFQLADNLGRLRRHIDEQTENLAARTTPAPQSLENRIRAAYMDAAGGREWERVRIADLRARLPDVDRATLDTELARLGAAEGGDTSVWRLDNPSEITAADEAAALRVGNEPRHIVRMRRGPDAAPAPQPAPGAAEAQAAVRFTREELAPRFGRPAPEMADLRRRVNQDPENRSAAPREETARTFLGPQSDTAEGQLRGTRLAEQVRRALAGSESEGAGRTAARDYVMSSMRDVVGRDGRVNLRSLDEWVRQNTGTMRAFPEIDQQITAMRRDIVNQRAATTQMQRQLEDATALRGRTEREIQNSAAALFLERDTPHAVAAIFESGDPVRKMQQAVGRLRHNPDAMRGLRTAVSDYLERRVTGANTAATTEGANPTSLAQMGDLFRTHRGTLEALYGAGSREMRALENAHRAVTDMARLSVRGVSGSETASLADQIGRLAERALRLPAPVGFGAVTGGMVARNVKLALGSIPGLNNDAAIRRLLQRMQTEPELALHLLTRDVPAARQRGWNRRLTELLAIQEGQRGEDERTPPVR